jgi:transcriptional regulator with XRE-family HTH domain
MSTVDKPATLTLDADGLTDLQIIAQQAPGYGAAFQRMLNRANFSQSALAHQLNISRSTVTQWCSEARWPKGETLRNALSCLGIDRKQLVDTWGVLLGTEIAPRGESQQIAVNIRNELLFESDKLERLLIIGRNLDEQIFIRQGFKAFEDTRSAEYFSARLEKLEEESRKRRLGGARNVTPAQAKASAGDVYETESPATKAENDTTIGSNTVLDNGAA